MKKYLNLFAILISAMVIFASCGDDEKKPTPKPPVPVVDPTILPRESTVAIKISNIDNPAAGLFYQAYQDTNYRFYFGADNSVLAAPKRPSTFPAVYISTHTDAGFKTAYTQSGQFQNVEYWVGQNNDQHFSFTMGKLYIDSTSTDTIKSGEYAGIHHYISGNFSFLTRDNNNGDITDSVSGTFLNVPLTK